MKCWKKIAFIVLLILPCVEGSTQSLNSANDLNILLVPYNRFNFHTEYKLSEIAEVNQIESKEVYNAFLGTLLKELVYNDSNLHFKVVDQSDLAFFMKNVNYSFDARKGYTSCNINPIPASEWENILDYYEADAIMFLTVYRIKSTSKSMAGSQSGRMPFSKHYIDYEMRGFDKSRTDVFGTFEFPLEINGTVLSSKGLKLTYLADAYEEFAIHINTQRHGKEENSKKSKR